MASGAAKRLHNMGAASVPSTEADTLSALLEVAKWMAAPGEAWRGAPGLQALTDRLTDALSGRHDVVVARVHPSLLPPPAICVVAASLSDDESRALDWLSEALSQPIGHLFERLKAGETGAMVVAAEPAPIRYPLVIPILVAADLWGVIAISEGADAPRLPPLVIETLQLIALQLSDRLEAALPMPERRKEGSERLLQAAIEAIEDGLVVYDAEHRVAAYNRAWRNHNRLIRPDQDLRGMRLADLYREYVRYGTWTEAQADGILRDILSGRSFGVPDRMMDIDGRHVRIRNFKIPGGGIVGLRTDVTETVRRERDLLRAREDAEAASRAKSTFLASVSHELRTPLNAIIGFSDVMQQEVFGALGVARYREYIEDIHRSGSLLLSLINDIMDMARIESGKVELRPEAFSIAAIAEDVLRLVRLRAEAKQITLLADCTGALPPVWADRRATTQILLNVAVNAVKFTPQGGKVTIAARALADAVEIKVVDTGLGIAPADLERLGRPFERVQVDAFDATPENKGTGLGLAISRALAELQGGAMRLESELGKGTSVTVRIPVRPR